MDVHDRYVIVRAAALDDLCVLGLQAADELGNYVLATSMRGAVAEIRCDMVPEPHLENH